MAFEHDSHCFCHPAIVIFSVSKVFFSLPFHRKALCSGTFVASQIVEEGKGDELATMAYSDAAKKARVERLPKTL
jgi:hypothetical protein